MENKQMFTKEELLVIKMGLTEMVQFFQKDCRQRRMYEAALQASEKVEKMLIECGVIKTIEYNI